MNSLIEQVYEVCHNVRSNKGEIYTFKKLVAKVRKEFKQKYLDIDLVTKKDKMSLAEDEFYVAAFYDATNDKQHETPIEVIVHHHFKPESQFSKEQITEFLIQIFDAVVHEYQHRKQSIKRSHKVYYERVDDYREYLQDPDEIDAYALSIAIELLRHMSKERAKRYMARITVLAKMRQSTKYISPNLNSYMAHFGLNPLGKRLAKKVFKHLDTLDRRYIFM